jgi:hypothetical protein
VKPSQDANDGFGLLVRAPVEHIALLCWGDVFEHEDSAVGPDIDYTAEKIGDASAQ